MKTTVSVSVREGKMEVRKSSWEKENWGPWRQKKGESLQGKHSRAKTSNTAL
jgi:hypothetical protein